MLIFTEADFLLLSVEEMMEKNIYNVVLINPVFYELDTILW